MRVEHMLGKQRQAIVMVRNIIRFSNDVPKDLYLIESVRDFLNANGFNFSITKKQHKEDLMQIVRLGKQVYSDDISLLDAFSIYHVESKDCLSI